MNFRTFIGIPFLCLLFSGSYCQPFPQAHAHNDYKHRHPLLDAIRHGFTSVEADVHLIGGKLIVAHTRPVLNSRTLSDLYLTPLDSIVKARGGKVYPGYAGKFYLMIDIKTNGDEVYRALKNLYADHPLLFQPSGIDKPVILFLSGNRPTGLIAGDPDVRVALDGRPDDLGKGYSQELMPIVSDNYNKWSAWHGRGTPLSKDLERVNSLATRVHAEGKKLRLWAIPDNPAAWDALLAAGVDIINTDHLSELEHFLNGRK